MHVERGAITLVVANTEEEEESGREARVPFQELIDLSITLM